MDAFKTKYPGFTALFALFSMGMIDLFNGSLTWPQKGAALFNCLPALEAFIPLAGGLANEAKSLAATPEDMVSGAELLVTDFQFSDAKAQAIIQAAFPIANSVGALVPEIITLVNAIKA